MNMREREREGSSSSSFFFGGEDCCIVHLMEFSLKFKLYIWKV